MTDIEQRLIEAAKRGDELKCTEPDNVVRAGLIRDLLIGRHGDLDPRGLMLTGARIEGVLDLDRVTAVVGLYLKDCTLDEPITAHNASLPDLMFHGGRYAGSRPTASMSTATCSCKTAPASSVMMKWARSGWSALASPGISNW